MTHRSSFPPSSSLPLLPSFVSFYFSSFFFLIFEFLSPPPPSSLHSPRDVCSVPGARGIASNQPPESGSSAGFVAAPKVLPLIAELDSPRLIRPSASGLASSSRIAREIHNLAGEEEGKEGRAGTALPG